MKNQLNTDIIHFIWLQNQLAIVRAFNNRNTMKRTILFIAFLSISFVLQAQESIHGSGGNGTGSGGTISFSFGQFAYTTYFQTSSSVAQGVQHPFEISYVPSLISVLDTTVSNGISSCYDALQNIFVAGTGHSVVIQDGANADFISGNSILFLPGFNAQYGSAVHGYITLTNEFCDGFLLKSIVESQLADIIKEVSVSEEKNNLSPGEKDIKIYPNPNNGCFKIDLFNFEERASVSVYNMTGSLFYTSEMEQLIQHEINLPFLKNGIYFVRITSCKEQFVKKIIVN